MNGEMNRPPLASDADLTATHNVFADIVAGRSPASVVYRDELTGAETAQMFLVGRKVAAAIRAFGLPCTGVFLFLADGATAGQKVPRVHLHVVPRFVGAELEFRLPERYFSNVPERRGLDEAAAKIR